VERSTPHQRSTGKPLSVSELTLKQERDAPNAYNFTVVQDRIVQRSGKEHQIWVKYTVTSYRVVDLVSARQMTRLKEA
jgi:hypothetical protein